MPELLTQPNNAQNLTQVAGMKSECRPTSNRNGGRLHVGIGGRHQSESAPYLGVHETGSSSLLDRLPGGGLRAPAGELSPHGRVRKGDREGWFDEIIGTGFVLITIDSSLHTQVKDCQHDLMEQHDMKLANLQIADGGLLGETIDVDGKYHSFMKEHGVTAIIIRPDFYIFGGAASAENTKALIERFSQTLAAAGVGLSGPDLEPDKSVSVG